MQGSPHRTTEVPDTPGLPPSWKTLLGSGGDFALGLAGVLLLISVLIPLRLPEVLHEMYLICTVLESVNLIILAVFAVYLASPRPGKPDYRPAYRAIGLLAGTASIGALMVRGIVLLEWQSIFAAAGLAGLAFNRSRTWLQADHTEKNRQRIRFVSCFAVYWGALLASFWLSIEMKWPGPEKLYFAHLAGAIYFLFQGLYDPIGRLLSRR